MWTILSVKITFYLSIYIIIPICSHEVVYSVTHILKDSNNKVRNWLLRLPLGQVKSDFPTRNQFVVSAKYK